MCSRSASVTARFIKKCPLMIWWLNRAKYNSCALIPGSKLGERGGRMSVCVGANVCVYVCERENVIQQPDWQHVSDESSGMCGGYSNRRDLNILTTDWEKPAVCLHRRRRFWFPVCNCQEKCSLIHNQLIFNHPAYYDVPQRISWVFSQTDACSNSFKAPFDWIHL